MFKRILLLAGFAGMISTLMAQDTLLSVSYRGLLDSIDSRVLSQKRYIQVFVPPSYKPGTNDKYDVLYVLDGGNWNMNVVSQVQRFIQNEGHMPPTIIVSVTGIDRNVELTPTVLKSWNAPTGGADKFMAYIKNELIPHVNSTYPSNGDNTLWGHSLSGMFAMYVLLNEPALFKSVIAADPSFWWDNEYVPKMAINKLQALRDSTVTLFISGRKGPAFHEMKIDTMESILKRYAPPSLKWRVVTYQDESHSSLRLKTTYDGLQFTYEGLSSAIDFYPMNGIVLPQKPFTIVYSDDSTHVHYTLNGAVPTEQSPQVMHHVSVNGPAIVTYRRLSNRSRYGQSMRGEFIQETLPAPLAKIRDGKAGGLRYTYYEGQGGQRLDVNATPLRQGRFDSTFKIDNLPRTNSYALVLDGFLEVVEEGYYTFFMRAGKGSAYWIDGKKIMYWDENEKRDIYSYLIPLSKGFHPVRIESFDKKEDFNLLYYYLTPGMPLTADAIPVPFERVYTGGSSRKKH